MAHFQNIHLRFWKFYENILKWQQAFVNELKKVSQE